MSGPGSTRIVKHRTWGSNTPLHQEWAVPRKLYHFGRLARWCWRHPRIVGAMVLVVVVVRRLGAALGPLVLIALAVGGLTGWIAWRQRSGDLSAFSVKAVLAEFRQRWAIEKQWTLACQTAGLTSRQGQVPKLRKVAAKGEGTYTAAVRAGRMGVPVPSMMKHTMELAEVIGCREVCITQTGPGLARLEFHWKDPVGRTLPLTHLPAAASGHLAYGIRQDGSVASIRWRMSLLIGGLTRRGKSNLLWTLLADAIRTNVPIRLYVSDPKGGVELDALEAHLGEKGRLIEVRQYAKTPAETVEMIKALESAMHVRQRVMKENNLRQIDPSWESPLVVLLLDETLPLTDLLRKGTDSPLGRIAYTGAACGYVVWACTQVAQVDAIGRFRDLIPQRICFATPNPQVTDSVLGQGAEAAGARCSAIQQAGVGFSYSEDQSHPRKFRAALVSDAETRLIASGKVPGRMVEVEREAKGDTALYRYWSQGDPKDAPPRYIGITGSVLRREVQHDKDLREFLEGDVRRTVEWFATRKAALVAEKAAIIAEKPTYNVIHNQANANRRRDRVRAVLARAED